MIRVTKEKEPKIITAENVKGLKTLHRNVIFNTVVSEFKKIDYKITSSLINASNYGVPQKRERVIIVVVRNDAKNNFEFPQKTTGNDKVPLSIAVPKVDIDDEKDYFSECAVEGLKKSKNNMKRGLAQNLDEPRLTVTSRLAKASLNSRDSVLLANSEKNYTEGLFQEKRTEFCLFRIRSNFPVRNRMPTNKPDAIPAVMFWHITRAVLNVFLSETVEDQSWT